MTENCMTSLEDRLKKLEELTLKLEGGQLTMDEAITAYTEGMQLALSCRKTLDEMTQKVEMASAQALATSPDKEN
jgi:exodeoxyribonuclease VII small subunit